MSRNVMYIKNYFVLVLLKSLLQSFPRFYITLQKVRYKGNRYSRKIVSKNSEIVIEGYPRSANSFSVKAFKFDNGDEYSIATHLHAYPQVIVGVQHNIPTIVLIRNPFDCVVSYMALLVQTFGLETIQKSYDIKWLLKDYITFYKKLKPYKDNVVVGVFDEVLKDFGKVIIEVNIKFNTDFKVFEHTQDHVKKVFSTSKTHLSPSEKRDDIKAIFVEQMEALRPTKLYKEAENLYIDWSNKHSKN